ELEPDRGWEGPVLWRAYRDHARPVRSLQHHEERTGCVGEYPAEEQLVRSIPPCSVNTSRALVTPVSVADMDKNYGYYKLYPTFLSTLARCVCGRQLRHSLTIDLHSSLGTLWGKGPLPSLYINFASD